MSNTKHTCTCQKCQNEINGLRKRVKELENKNTHERSKNLWDLKDELWNKSNNCDCTYKYFIGDIDLFIKDYKDEIEYCKTNHRLCGICLKIIFKKSLICHKDNHQNCIKENKHKIIKADDMVNIDHIIPKQFGGTDDISNLQLTHTICNNIKGKRCLHPKEKIDVRTEIPFLFNGKTLKEREEPTEIDEYLIWEKTQNEKLIIIQCKLCFQILNANFDSKNQYKNNFTPNRK